MDLGLDGKVAIITGGSKGLGLAIAEQLSAEGARVAICARHMPVMQAAADAISANTGGEVLPIVADMSRLSDIQHLMNNTASHFGRIDVLVNNATSEPFAKYDALSDELWHATLEVKLMGYVRCCREVIPHMRKAGGGRIINIAGDAGPQPVTWHMPGGAVNSAVLNFTKALSTVLAPDGILVNAVNPAATATPRWDEIIELIAEQRGSTPDAIRQMLTDEIPLKRSSRADEVAPGVAFLASNRATFITGAAFNVDGGRIKGI